ncbi:MAG: hypothetical protein NTW19_18925 [Planctomycetota bacterium]|nr:hypothetical protein [Planctomycetota bacterium]
MSSSWMSIWNIGSCTNAAAAAHTWSLWWLSGNATVHPACGCPTRNLSPPALAVFRMAAITPARSSDRISNAP